MILYPNAKINIGLKILNKRPDGYHNISSIIFPIQLSDILEFIPSSDKELKFMQTGISIKGDVEDNLCVKVYRFFRKEYHIPILKIHLHKNIPVQAGLGGGSSDAAFFIKGLNDFFSLNLSVEKMKTIALKFGSDCPFFIENKPALVSGRGEILQTISLRMEQYNLIIVKFPVAISTAEAYASIIPKENYRDIMALVKQPIGKWKDKIKNDFETFAFLKYPELKHGKNKLLKAGAVFAQMTGSGSAIYGIFEKDRSDIDFYFPSAKILMTGFKH